MGPGKAYTAPCAGFAAAADGDTIEIDGAGSYLGDVCVVAKNNLTIKGVNGRPHIQAGGKSAAGKAIWVLQGHDTSVDNVELSGCSVPDKNGAGIRQEGRNLTVRRSYFHDNENGILGGADAESVYLFEDSEFADNGAGDGQSHNMYIGEIKSFTLRGCYSHDAKVGHLVKSRALANYILYNRLTDERGSASYQLDLPQGGLSYLIGNVLAKSLTTGNSSFVSYAREQKRNPGSALWVVSNTFFNVRSAGTFVAVASDVAAVTLRNNIFAGNGTVCDLPSAVVDHNVTGSEGFAGPTSFDFHLLSSSGAVDHGVAAGTAMGQVLDPVCQYAHPAHAVVRNVVGSLDQGAFELGGESSTACGTTVPSNPLQLDAGSAGQGGDAGTGTQGGARDAATQQADASVQTPAPLVDGGHPERADAAVSADPRARRADTAGCSASNTPSPNSQVLGAFTMLMLAAVALRRHFK